MRDEIISVANQNKASHFVLQFHRKLALLSILNNYEGTDLEELALDIGFHPVDQTDAGKLAREVGLSITGDSSLVPNQKKRRDDALGL